jgi:hypothetical protein
MGAIKNTLKKEINENNRQRFNDTKATIVEYNPILNVAKIRFTDPNSGEKMYRENVAITNTLGGVTGSGIYPGQACTIAFIGNNIHNPVITGLTGSNYTNKTCTDQGAYIVDADISSVQKPKDITPMISNWIEEDNTSPTKYNNDLGDYTNIDVSAIIHEVLNTLDKYKNTEQGISSLKTKSTIKFRDNGDIDVFVANNIGIKISKADKSISLYGKLKVNGKEIDLSKISDILDEE